MRKEKSEFMSELKRISLEKGLIEDAPIEKKASTSLKTTGDIFADLIILGEELRNRGFFIQADALENKAMLYKKAYNDSFVPVKEEEPSYYNLAFDDVMTFAHQLANDEGFDSKIDGKRKFKNVNETQEDMKAILKDPTGNHLSIQTYSNKQIIEMVKLAQEGGEGTVLKGKNKSNLQEQYDNLVSQLGNPSLFNSYAQLLENPEFYSKYLNLDQAKDILNVIKQASDILYQKKIPSDEEFKLNWTNPEWSKKSPKFDELKSSINSIKTQNKQLQSTINRVNGIALEESNLQQRFVTTLNDIINVAQSIEKEDLGKVNAKIKESFSTVLSQIQQYQILDDSRISNVITNSDYVERINIILSEPENKLIYINQNIKKLVYKPNLEDIKAVIKSSALSIQKCQAALGLNPIPVVDDIIKSTDSADTSKLNDFNKTIQTYKALNVEEVKAKYPNAKIDEFTFYSSKIKSASFNQEKKAQVIDLTKFVTGKTPSGTTKTPGQPAVPGGGGQVSQKKGDENITSMQNVIRATGEAINKIKIGKKDAESKLKDISVQKLLVIGKGSIGGEDGIWGSRTKTALEELKKLKEVLQVSFDRPVSGSINSNKPSDDSVKQSCDDNIATIQNIQIAIGAIFGLDDFKYLEQKKKLSYLDIIPKTKEGLQEVSEDSGIAILSEHLVSLSTLKLMLDSSGFINSSKE